MSKGTDKSAEPNNIARECNCCLSCVPKQGPPTKPSCAAKTRPSLSLSPLPRPAPEEYPAAPIPGLCPRLELTHAGLHTCGIASMDRWDWPEEATVSLAGFINEVRRRPLTASMLRPPHRKFVAAFGPAAAASMPWAAGAPRRVIK
jgi:hypothetical protein